MSNVANYTCVDLTDLNMKVKSVIKKKKISALFISFPKGYLMAPYA